MGTLHRSSLRARLIARSARARSSSSRWLNNDWEAFAVRNAERLRELLDSAAESAYSGAEMALRDLWRKLTRRRTEDKELDLLRPTRDKLPALDHFVQPPKPTGQDKPKY